MEREWIPISIDLHRRREVIIIAALTKTTSYEVVGRLVEFWGWVNTESADGRLPGLTVEQLVEVQGFDDKFLSALLQVGWLQQTDEGLVVPNFERYMSMSSKHRARMRREAQLRQLSALTPSANGKHHNRHKHVTAEDVDRAAKLLEEHWHQVEQLPTIRKWTETRRYLLAQRLAEPNWLQDALHAINKMAACPFLLGQNQRRWRADIDWFLQPDSVAKILEGKYDSTKTGVFD